MLDDEDRLANEQLATSIEWGLESAVAEGVLGESPFLRASAAEVILTEMIDRYPGLQEWAEAARSAAVAQAAVDIARAEKCSVVLISHLAHTALQARVALDGLPGPNADDPRRVLAVFADLKRMVASRPEGYQGTPPGH